jgi:hypothetical protein
MRFRKALTFLILAMGLVVLLPLWAQQKPFTQEQISNMVRDGFARTQATSACQPSEAA